MVNTRNSPATSFTCTIVGVPHPHCASFSMLIFPQYPAWIATRVFGACAVVAPAAEAF